jgi:two-component sensor histidine kinase
LRPLTGSIPLRYGSAVLSVLLATLARTVMGAILPHRSIFFPYILAVLFTGWYGGLGPALVTLVLGTLTASYFFLAPVHSFAIRDTESQLQCVLFVIIGLTTALLSESQKRAREAAEASAMQAHGELAERMRAEADLKRTIEEVNLLVEAGQLLGGTLDPDQIYSSLRGLVARVMDCDGLLVSSFREEDGMLRCVYAWVEGQPLDTSVFPPIQLTPESSGMQTTVLRTRRPLRVPDVEEREKQNSVLYHVDADGTVLDEPPDENRTRSLLMVPILLEGQVLGTVQVTSLRKDAYTEDQLRALEALVQQVSAASRNAFLYQQAQTEIAERRSAEAALQRNQAQIEDLNARLQHAMTETHHRVKNNLQVVAAMIDMQAMEYGDTIPRREAERLRSHVSALAALHDLLTRQARESGETEVIASTTVLNRLVSMLRTVSPREIRLEVQEISLSVRQASAMALVLQELVSNSLKHGAGEIEIVFAAEPDMATLEVCDSGPGYPAGFDPRAGNTGMELLDTAVRWDLGGRSQFDNREAGGARARIRFPLSP